MVSITITGFNWAIWCLGRLSVVCWSLVSLGAAFHWVRVERKGRVFELRNWGEVATHNLLLTYFHLVCSFSITALSAMSVWSSELNLALLRDNPYYTVIGTIGALTLLTTCLEFTPYSKKHNLIKTSAWFLHSVVISQPLAYFGGEICIRSVLGAVFCLGLAVLVAYTANVEFIEAQQGKVLKFYYLVFSCSGLCLMLNNIEGFVDTFLLAVAIFGGILLYTVVFIINVNYVINEVLTNEDYDPIYMSAVMYLCSINLFIRVCLYNLVMAKI